jgi:hypothetical protein
MLTDLLFDYGIHAVALSLFGFATAFLPGGWRKEGQAKPLLGRLLGSDLVTLGGWACCILAFQAGLLVISLVGDWVPFAKPIFVTAGIVTGLAGWGITRLASGMRSRFAVRASLVMAVGMAGVVTWLAHGTLLHGMLSALAKWNEQPVLLVIRASALALWLFPVGAWLAAKRTAPMDVNAVT